jgi:hypothetical protein
MPQKCYIREAARKRSLIPLGIIENHYMKDTLNLALEKIYCIDSINVSMGDTLFHKVILINKSSSSWTDSLQEYVLPVGLALVAGMIALYQVKANVVSSARIKWIEDLREAMSELYQTGIMATLHYHLHKKEQNADESNVKYQKYVQSHSRFLILSNKIKLLVNTKEENHKKLVDSLSKVELLLSDAQERDVSQREVEVELEEMVKISRKIFKKEWNKSKKWLRF